MNRTMEPLRERYGEIKLSPSFFDEGREVGVLYASIEALNGDRAELQFTKRALLTPNGLGSRLRREIERRPRIEHPAIKAAYARLMSWVEAGSPDIVEGVPESAEIRSDAVPQEALSAMLEPRPAAQSEGPYKGKGETADAKAIARWQAELAAQSAREVRRRGGRAPLPLAPPTPAA